jgi:hypothetical protein
VFPRTSSSYLLNSFLTGVPADWTSNANLAVDGLSYFRDLDRVKGVETLDRAFGVLCLRLAV